MGRVLIVLALVVAVAVIASTPAAPRMAGPAIAASADPPGDVPLGLPPSRSLEVGAPLAALLLVTASLLALRPVCGPVRRRDRAPPRR